jgi:uncharacterized protein (TIGR00255 family)
MTGFGSARFDDGHVHVSAEIRAVNNRYLKVTTKCPDPYNIFETEIERLVRAQIRRGTVQVMLRVYRESAPEDFRLSQTAVRSYLEQLSPLVQTVNSNDLLGHILTLPGVVLDAGLQGSDPMELWPQVGPVVQQALDSLQRMRVQEGQAMRLELLDNCTVIRENLEKVAEMAPRVVEAYRDRLHERVRSLLAQMDIEVNRADLIREVSIFAERSDVAEEVVRLRSHLDQFAQALDSPESNGRKLDFLTQEMFREANTIGSKASDVEISRHTVEIKGAIEKIREMTQNVE